MLSQEHKRTNATGRRILGKAVCPSYLTEWGEKLVDSTGRMLNHTHTHTCIALPSGNLCNVFSGELGNIIYLPRQDKNIPALCSCFGNFCRSKERFLKMLVPAMLLNVKPLEINILTGLGECTVYFLCQML